ncbi:hypothetical protein ACUN0C_18710 [Faunimonas sp. B44]|uniref:hypothetical protein n=1 Tax=Faunimonas sp. B44 TaxID=3461493 RepID=UPI0040441076
MTKPRNAAAFDIQLGACNPSGIAHAIIEACREVREEGGNPCTDAAVQLMAHQLAWICNVRDVDANYRDYVEKIA